METESNIHWLLSTSTCKNARPIAFSVVHDAFLGYIYLTMSEDWISYTDFLFCPSEVKALKAIKDQKLELQFIKKAFDVPLVLTKSGSQPKMMPSGQSASKYPDFVDESSLKTFVDEEKRIRNDIMMLYNAAEQISER